MIAIISIISFAASLYSIQYLEQYKERSIGTLGFCTNLFIATMLMVVSTANAFYFLLFWEMMTAVSYFLVTFESENKQAVQAGYIYMLVAHAGGSLLMIAFLIFFINTGSFSFADFRQAQFSPGLRNLVFLLALIGFGTKSGMVPFHFWTPSVYSAAPAHIAAIMSSVLKKVAIYGIFRVCVDFLGAEILWWGLLVLGLGAVSAVLGVLFALAERDIKRMLAYSSVENIGVILLGVGCGMIGLAEGLPAVTLLGFLSALYHLVNHSFFKSLLFMGAGSVHFRTQTHDLNYMGGLSRNMPWTSLTFLIGAFAVSAIPPLNGFVSEWFTYHSLFSASSSSVFAVRTLAPLAAAALALTGALTAMCFVKAFGSAFSGPARSEAAASAREAPVGMVAAMFILATGCILLGLGAPLAAPFLVNVAADIPSISSLQVTNSAWIFPVDPNQAVLSPPLIAILLLGLLSVPFLTAFVYGGFRAGRRFVDTPWACGYGYTAEMSVSASSFDQPVKSTFRPIFTLRQAVRNPYKLIAQWGTRLRHSFTSFEPVIERTVTIPVTTSVSFLSRHIQALQMGDIRVYCFYIVFTLAVLLIVIFG